MHRSVEHKRDSNTDAVQIRAKRLAKLGGSSSATPNQAPSPTGSPAPTSSKQNAVPSPPTGSSSTPAAPGASGVDNTQRASNSSTPQTNVQPRTVSPVKRERDGSQRPKPAAAGKAPETLESWQDKMLRQVFRVTLNPEETRDLHGHSLIYLASTRDDLVEQSAPLQLNIDVVEAAIAEAASQAPGGKTFKYLLACFKRVSRTTRSTKYSSPEDPKHSILAETRRLCMSYCVFAITMPEMFGDNVQPGNPLVEHMLSDPESDSGICFDFLNEASSRFDE